METRRRGRATPCACGATGAVPPPATAARQPLRLFSTTSTAATASASRKRHCIARIRYCNATIAPPSGADTSCVHGTPFGAQTMGPLLLFVAVTGDWTSLEEGPLRGPHPQVDRGPRPILLTGVCRLHPKTAPLVFSGHMNHRPNNQQQTLPRPTKGMGARSAGLPRRHCNSRRSSSTVLLWTRQPCCQVTSRRPLALA